MARPSSIKIPILHLFQEHHLLSATHIVQLLHAKKMPVNKTSVYRNLEQLLKAEALCQHVFDGKEAVYELRLDHHDHLICETCGTIEPAHCSSPPPTTIGTFTVRHHHMTMYGLCGTCTSTS